VGGWVSVVCVCVCVCVCSSIVRISQAKRTTNRMGRVQGDLIVSRAGGGGGEKLKINRDDSPGTCVL
jgi:hypothetical protein